ncbi:MAG: nicotinate-nucleotide--dimethylbenzimidazole phosphoribosyltransferase [Halioglobus sp.]|jgi:nicotinate-nucleotide--dimethylbenzimidazole phosphoribosyltransferase
MESLTQLCPLPCADSTGLALRRQQELTKPPGSLGELENIAVRFAGFQGSEKPSIESLCVRVFAADHGVCAQRVSAFPSEVTSQMIYNLLNGGAAISVLSRAEDADFAVVNMGTLQPTTPAVNLVNVAIAPGTFDFSQREAMSENDTLRALEAGANLVDQLDCDLFIAGEMGIGNTTSASAITAALLNKSAEQVVGRGTGIDDATLLNKRNVIETALSLHSKQLGSALGILRCVGGLEIAGMCGAYIRSAQRGIPILLDGFISTAAALLAVRLNPSVQPWLMAGHLSVEPAHSLLLDTLSLQPLLSLGMRLGEGSGAAAALPLIHSALLLHNTMATFSEASVSGSNIL